MTPTNCFTWLCCYTHMQRVHLRGVSLLKAKLQTAKNKSFLYKKKFFSSLFLIHGWDSESVFLIYEIIYEKRRLFPFLDQNHESISLYSLNKVFFSISGRKAWKYFFFVFMKQGWESESISLYLWNKVEKVKVFLYIYETRFRKHNNFLYFHETRFRKWKFFFIVMKQCSESENVSLLFMKQGSESESVSLFSWNKVEKCNE